MSNIVKFITTASISALFVSVASSASAQSLNDEIIVQGNHLYSDQVNALKVPTPIIDVPQSLSIVTAEDITKRAYNSIGQIIDYTPGVNTSQGEGHRDAVVFRGVRSTADFYLDGVRDDVQYYRSLYNLEQVEILRGPNALLFGRGGTGGLLNRVTKKGQIGEQFTGYKASVNTFGAFDVVVDSNFEISDTSAFRVNAYYESLNNHRDFFDGDRFGINPTARFELTPSTTLDVSYEYNNNERFIDRGIVSAAPDGTTSAANNSGLRTPIEALDGITFGDEELNTAEFEAHVFRANLQHEFNDNLKGNFTASYGDYDKLYQNFFPVGYSASNATFGGIETVDLDGYVDTTQRENFTVAGNLIGEFSTRSIGHTVVAGAEYLDTSNNNDRFNTFFDTSQDDVETFAIDRSTDRAINLVNGVGVNAAGVATTNSFAVDINDIDEANLEVFSAYIQDQIEINQYVDIIVGARFDSFDFTVEDLTADAASANRVLSRKDEEISPRLGLILKPKENISIYGSFSESFIPRSGGQFAEISDRETRLAPDVYQNLEAGIKWDFAKGLSFTAAVFEIEESSPQPDTSPGADTDNQSVIVDSTVEGFEAQIQGKLTDDWHVTAGYSYLDGDVASDSGAGQGETIEGRRPRELPESTFSVWSNYQFTDQFGAGLGLTHQGESFADTNNTTTLASYTRLDAAAYYDVNESLRLQVNVENLTDTNYFPNSHTDDQISVGAPLNARFTVSGRF